MAVWSAVISGIVAAGSAIAGGVAQKKATDRANKTNLALGEQSRQDILGQRKREELRSDKAIFEGKKQFGQNLAFQKQQATLGQRERKEERTYGRQQQALQNALQMLNSNQNLANNVAKMWGGR